MASVHVLVFIGAEDGVDGMVCGPSSSFTIFLTLGELAKVINVDVYISEAGTERTGVQDGKLVCSRREERGGCVGKGF